MAENDFNISLVGKLDGTKSKTQINADIEALKKQLNNIEVSAKLDSKTASNLTSQLNNIQVYLKDVNFTQNSLDNLVKQVNNALQGINISGFNGGSSGKFQQVGQQIAQQVSNGYNSSIQKGNLQKNFQFPADKQNNVAKQAQEYFRGISNGIVTVNEQMTEFEGKSKLSGFIVNIKNAKGEIESLKYSLRNITDDDGTVTGQMFMYTGGSINDHNVVKQYEELEKTITQYQIKLNNLQSKYQNLNLDYSGFNDVFDGFKNGEKSVNDLALAFNALENKAKNTVQSLKSQKSSLDPVQQTLNNMRDIPSMLTTLEAGMNSLKDKSGVAGISVNDLKKTYDELNKEMNNNGGKVPTIDSWLEKYRQLMSVITSSTKSVEALKKAEESDNSQAQKQASYYSTILDNYREIYSLKKQLLSAGEEESKIINKQIRSLNSSNASAYKQLGKQNLKDDNWDTQVSDLKEELDYSFKKTEASQKDKKNQTEINEAKKESLQITKELESAYQRIQDIKIKMASLDKDDDSEKLSALSQEETSAKADYNKLYNKYRKRKNFDKESWQETKSDIDATTADKINYNNAKSQDSLNKAQKQQIANFEVLKTKWQEQGILVGDFKDKVDKLSDSLSKVGSKSKLDTLKSQIESLKTEASQKDKKNQTEINEAKKESLQITKELESAYQRIQDIKIKMASLDKDDDSEKLSALSQEETSAKADYNKLYNKYRKRKNFDKESWQETKSDIDATTADKINYNNAKSQDSLNKAQKQQIANFEVLKTKWQEQGILVGDFKDKVDKLSDSLSKVGSKSKLDTLKSQIESLKTEASQKDKIQDIQFKIDSESYSKDIAKIQSDINKIGKFTLSDENNSALFDKAKESLFSLKTAYEDLSNAGKTDQERIEAEEKYQEVLLTTKNLISQINIDKDDEILAVGSTERINMIATLNTYLEKNTAMGRENKAMIESWIATLSSSTDVTKGDIKKINSDLKTLDSNLRSTGKLGLSLVDKAKQAFEKFGGWSLVTGSMTKITGKVKEAVSELKELDSILTEISKTSDLTEQQIKKLGDSSFETASDFGKKASDYLNNVTEMYRAGFENAEEMAELSLLAQAAGDLDSSSSDDYLIATNAAYDYKGSVEELNDVLDSQNYITNNAAVSMQDMSDATSEAASVASEYGVEIEELSALIAVAVSKTRESGSEVGNALKSIFINLQDTTNNSIVEAFNAVGVSMTKVVDGSERLKTPIELIKELSEVYNSLPEGDTRKANILSDIAGKVCQIVWKHTIRTNLIAGNASIG